MTPRHAQRPPEAARPDAAPRLDRPLSVSELAKPFPVSLPAIMKHLDVLTDAGLLTRTKAGRTVSCHLNAEPMEEAMGWLARYQRFWTERLDALEALLEARRKGEG